jgi:hypothetical protein
MFTFNTGNKVEISERVELRKHGEQGHRTTENDTSVGASETVFGTVPINMK